MYSQLKSFSFMGMSNSEMLLSEKDLNSMEFNFLVRPALEFDDDDDHCVISPLEESDDDHKQEQVQERDKLHQEEEDKCKLLVSTLRIKLPSLGEFKIQEEEEEDNLEIEEDGFKTPTSLDQKIPIILPCPPAPRKPKSLPSNKRKLPSRRTVLLDLSNEIESLFPPSLRADLGKKIKKVRHQNDPN